MSSSNNAVSRRRFLATAGAASLGWALRRSVPRQPAADSPPNIIVVLFDTLSARHMSLYGYGRPTTPHICALAERAHVYHRHYAGGNYTTPGTATLLTGTLPWTHRAINPDGQILATHTRPNLFSLLPTDYHRLAFSQNPVADVFLDQFAADIDERVRRPSFHEDDPAWLLPHLPNDRYLAYYTKTHLALDEVSLLFGALDRIRLELRARRARVAHLADYPLGLPRNGLHSHFTVEATVDGVADLADAAPAPFLAYFHLWPPHAPYYASARFAGRFEADGFTPPAKPRHPMSTGETTATITGYRARYDEFIAHIDAEFGRLFARLESAGLLDNAIVVLTSDHGELFERGIYGHINLVLYEGLIHIPLVIWHPRSNGRVDIHTPTSAVQVAATLAAWTGQTSLAGYPLLPGPASDVQPVFALEAKRNSHRAPLTEFTATIVLGNDKLILYSYGGQTRVELYDVNVDPEELDDQATARPALAANLRARLEAEMTAHMVPGK